MLGLVILPSLSRLSVVSAQTDTIRYVNRTTGSYNNDGRSWATAKDRIQDAINDLREYMEQHHLTSGSVYIAAGTYIPTESTENSGGSMLNTSFKIYSGIHVYGGFNPDTAYARVNEPTPGDRMMVNGKKCKDNWADPQGVGVISASEIASQWDLQHKTILTGNHSSAVVSYQFDSIRGRYNTTYPASSYHVVWFATNGKYTVSDDALKDHYKPLVNPASLDGCVISSGNASSRNTLMREHTAYGGGVYMVGNSTLRNCIVERCNATLRGGGIYADGGGEIEFCYVHTCQSMGVGVVQGYGGGVCIDHEGSIGHSHITSCAARCGAGLMISHVPDEYPWDVRVANPVLAQDTATAFYSPYAAACVINNNTANAEGGGIYLAEGGTVNHCTVTANNCSGPDVTYYGRRHGRTGGIYVRNCGMIFNSVFWGNRCESNNDIQFASVRQSGSKETHEIFVFHTAFMNHDISDWTGVRKEKVFSLDRSNLPIKGSNSNHPCFFSPTVDPNNWDTYDPANGIYGAGVFMHLARTVDIPGPRIWHLTSYSALDQKGVQWNSSVQNSSKWLVHAHTDYGVVTNPFEPVSTLGALVRRPDPLTYELIPQQGEEGRTEGGDLLPTLFIDPNRKGSFDESGAFVQRSKEGDSWDVPIKDLGEALSFFRQYLVDDEGGNHHYMIPALDANGMPTGDPVRYEYVQILVKEGTLTTVGHGNYLDQNIRSAAIRLVSHMRLYGGYPSSLTGTSTEGRNPRSRKSIITSNISDIHGEAAYQNNSAHVVAMVNAEHTIIDGFTLSDANTHNVYLSNSAKAGGGILVNNSSVDADRRINMVGNQIRNCAITNCSSPKGAAVYVNGEHPMDDDEICYAELLLSNCIIRNNSADYTKDDETINDHGIITANGRAYVHVEHCTVVNNVGFPFKADSKDTENDGPIVCPHEEHGNESIYHGYIRVDNSLVFCNSDVAVEDHSQLAQVGHVMSVNEDGQQYVFGKYNLFDADLVLHQANPQQPRGFFANGYTVPITDHFLPDGVTSHFIDDIADIPADSAGRANQCIFTRTDITAPTFPTFRNPSRNVGHSPTGDKPLYGGIVSYEPLTTNPCVNAAGRDAYTTYYDYDRSDIIKRDRGGAPDVGAVENTNLPEAVIYVTPEGAGKRDGSSWSNAIAGNTVYRLYNAPAADGDSVDIASGARLINQSTGAPVTTEDTRYCGGYAQKYIYPIFTDRGRNISRNVEINKYIGGDSPRMDTIGIDTTANASMSFKYNNGTIPADYVSSLAPDPKYPYGEMSGVSRYVYRSAYNYSPLTEDAKSVMLDGTVPNPGKPGVTEMVNSGRLVVRNERTENYVSGLQYAVEQASAYNKSIHKDSVQVWVGAGKYTDYKGYIMRDSVSVYGGFPVGKFPAPGMNERRALMSDVVAIPKSKENEDLDAGDYESILQISDVNPKKSNTQIEPTAIKFTDDSATVKLYITNNVTKLSDHNTINYYRWIEGTDMSSTYMRYPDMLNGSTNVFGQRYKDPSGGTKKVDRTRTTGNWGGIIWSNQDVVYQYFGDSWKNTYENHSWELVYEDRTNNICWNSFKFDNARTVVDADGNSLGTVPRGMELTGVMNTMSVWQTMKHVPAGSYRLQIDLGAYYTNYPDETNTGITFYILDANEDIVAEQPLYCKDHKLKRYTFAFEQPSDGDLTVRIMSSPGTKAEDPASGPLGDNCDGTKDNYRNVTMSNVHLIAMTGGDYIFDHTEEVDNESKTISSTSLNEEYASGTKKKRNSLRKRVLQMPDITNPVFMHGLGDPVTVGKYQDVMAHCERTTKPERQSNASGGQLKLFDPNYKEYNNVYWDGFTIRHGFIQDHRMSHGGGAGVAMYEGARLVNCIVTDNMAAGGGQKGGGVFCDGSNSSIENCFILNNISTTSKGSGASQNQQFAGGLFLYEGTCFNTLIANNYANGPGGGLGLCVGKFYNNTLAYNTSNNNVGGLRIATGADPAILMANTIIYGNNGLAIDMTATSNFAPFLNCYIQSATKITKAAITRAINISGTDNYGVGNTFYNGQAASAVTTPFGADVDGGGNYTGGAKTNNDFALRQASGIYCINSGTEDFAGTLEEALEKASKTAIPDKNRAVYRAAVAGVELPDNDVVYAKRIQDCQVDIGAYEYNAAYSIKPDTITHPGHAIFYVSFLAEGDASASSPENAACKQKLQLVLDAAGRYKHSLMTLPTYNKGTAGTYTSGQPNKHWTVEVRLEGDSTNSTKNNDYAERYTATRSTRHSEDTYQDNTLDYSFIVPHGIQVLGGYTKSFYHYETADGDTVPAGTEGASVVDERDALTYRSIFSGHITSSTGASGQTYHVITFTNDLFNPDNERIIGDGKQLEVLTAEKDRAVVDGLFIMDGNADGPDPSEQTGGGCIVTAYAHVRNCVVQDNNAFGNGGGLYLKPNALVSGTILKNNTADIGGGMYIEAPVDSLIEEDENAYLARVFYTTICDNSARSSAGGLFFANTYARVNSSALWHNAANDNANVSGNFARTDSVAYPMNYCAVESRRLEGQGNIELSPKETEGVRWDRQDPFNAILYYPIEMSSTLSRAGMNYPELDKARAYFTTLDTIDIAGVSRKRWYSDGSYRHYAWGTDTLVTKNNDVIDIGARAINKNYAINVDTAYVMHRLYVMHTDLIDSKAARALQDNLSTDSISNMYRQMGSCILNPFHRLSDAFDYIIQARMKNPAKYRNVRFEIFVEQGTYYPFHDAYGRQGEVRMNTFLVPEAVLIVGGVDSRPADHKYGQEGFKSPFGGIGNEAAGIFIAADGENDITVPGTEYTINFAYTDSIRLRDSRHRPMRDNNLNSVIEPWELERQTILSGNAVAGEDFTHVYHVVTCHADDRYVGPRPIKYKRMNPDYGVVPNAPILIDPIGDYDEDDYEQESDLSILARTIGFDGLQITGGYANHVNPNDTAEDYNKQTYFRGGGIFVDGNWTKTADVKPVNMTEKAKYNIPIVVENSFFTNNMAGNGGGIYSNGGIYMYGCRMTQNYSQGPMTKLDQLYIPWTAGGCIATNAVCDVSNTLFDNNEARRGLYPLSAASEDLIPYSDARQGFGGVLSVATDSYTRVVNCHFMRNKAVAYPAIYNFTPNDFYDDPEERQFAFNSLFWGNEVFNVESLADLEHAPDGAPSQTSIDAFNNYYKASRTGVFHYDATSLQKYETLFAEYKTLYQAHMESDSVFHPAVIAKLMELREQGDKMEGLYFCSYRLGYGPVSMKPTMDGFLLTGDEYRNFVDPRAKNVKIRVNSNGDIVEDYAGIWSHVQGNNNTLINRVNTATDGPNFKQPTFVAGIDGYMQNADWLQARMNLTTDQGWGYLKQNVGRAISYYITKYTGTTQYKTEEEAWSAISSIPGANRATDIYGIKGMPVASFKPANEQPSPGAMYNFLAKRYGTFMSASNAPLPLGDQYYMSYTRSTSDSEMGGNMERISRNPKTGVKDVYIDLGIYEYQYVQLDIRGQEIDTMWVATKVKDPVKHDGLTWETPTTDLQTAIDILMSSHNNHDKYICFLGDPEGGTFSPANILDNRRAFVISSNSLSPLLPDSAEASTDYGVRSLTFLGGYSFDTKDAKRDPQANPTVVEMPHVGNENQLNQLFIVEDMTRQMVQANFIGEYTSRDSVVIPIVFDGITFINPYSTKDRSPEGYNTLGGQLHRKGGAAIYYRWQRQYEGDPGSGMTPNFDKALHPDSALIDGAKVTLPKLTVSNCIFMDNGARTADHEERSAAVRIDHGGGSSLIVNSLFHSNAGAPIYARTYDVLEEDNDLADVPNDVVIVNSTFALNDGHIRLESDNSEIHNSLIWLDDLDNDTTVQLQMGADQWDKNENRNREGIAGRMTHNAVWGCFQNHAGNNDPGDAQVNHPLSTENNDIAKGPGFVSPFITATTSAQRRERSFRLNPSVRTMGKADTTVYRQKVFFRQYPNLDEGSPYWRRSNGFKRLTIVSLVNDSDLASKPRYSGQEGMERGAYECLAVLQRVLYVDPVKADFAAGDGSNWEKAFGQGQLQNAIDAAAVYTYIYQDLDRESRKAYVFVKGQEDVTENLNINARDGVFVFGSVPSSFRDTAFVDPESNKFTNSECQRYINYVRATCPGVASPVGAPTSINSIHVTGDEFNTGFLLDGFLISNLGKYVSSPILLDNTMTTLRNCLIIDNYAPSQPVADIRRGLIYNCLFFNDSADAVIRVGENGLALNNTLVTDNPDVTLIDDSEAASGAVQNNITFNTQLSTPNCFAPYLSAANPYTLPAYLSGDKVLSYQLHEHSTMIDAGTDEASLPALFDSYKADKSISFALDRDILGNPRRIGASVDMGALETWKVQPKQALEVTALTNRLLGHEESMAATDEQRNNAFTTHYGGNQYPHPGSVVYLMDSAAMTLQYQTDHDFKDFKNDPIIFRPGFMLLRPGASFFGNGHEVRLNYLAAEKKFVNQQYSMTAFPFNYNVGNITVNTYNDAEGTISSRLSPFTFNTYQYSGAARSVKDYVFQPDNSSLWLRVDTTNRTATDGYLMDFGAVTDTVLRFNAYAPIASEPLYQETDDNKSIFLTQYDRRNAGEGAALEFTRMEDMGWNMKGLPWLVSDYRTDTVLEGESFLRQMYIPHVFYQMDGANALQPKGDQINTARSWDRATHMSMGKAFLTQTATREDKEEVIFHLPYYDQNVKVGRPLIRFVAKPHKRSEISNLRSEISNLNSELSNLNSELSNLKSDILTLFPDPKADKNVAYRYGRDGIKWMSDETTAQVWLMDLKRTSRISLLGAAPTEVDIPMGVYVPALEGESASLSCQLSLPEKEAFRAYQYVWIIDYEKNTRYNLLQQDYTLDLAPGEYTNRFAVRIGGFKQPDELSERTYTVFAHEGTLHIRGLIKGDRIAVYSPAGQLICTATATFTDWTMPLFYQSGYIVLVNDKPHKVVNM